MLLYHEHSQDCRELALLYSLSTADDDKSIVPELKEVLPQTQPPVSDRPKKWAPGRGRGPPGVSEVKVFRKGTSQHPAKEDAKKKKGSDSAFFTLR